MTDLIKQWGEYVESMGSVMGEVEHMAQQMADRIAELEKEIEVLHKEVRLLEIGFDASQAKLTKAVEALKSLHHAVCGETGFASAVRNDSGKAYPWEALDIADAQTRNVLAGLEGK